MHHLLFAASLRDGRELCISPISLDAYEANQAQNLGDDTGYFIYECDPTAVERGIEVLAKAASYEAAMRLVDVIAASLVQPTHHQVTTLG